MNSRETNHDRRCQEANPAADTPASNPKSRGDVHVEKAVKEVPEETETLASSFESAAMMDTTNSTNRSSRNDEHMFRHDGSASTQDDDSLEQEKPVAQDDKVGVLLGQRDQVNEDLNVPVASTKSRKEQRPSQDQEPTPSPFDLEDPYLQQQPAAPSYPSIVAYPTGGDEGTCASSVTLNLTDIHSDTLYPSLFQLQQASTHSNHPPGSPRLAPVSEQFRRPDPPASPGGGDGHDRKPAAAAAAQSSPRPSPQQRQTMQARLEALEREATAKKLKAALPFSSSTPTEEEKRETLTALEDQLLDKGGAAMLPVLGSQRLSAPTTNKQNHHRDGTKTLSADGKGPARTPTTQHASTAAASLSLPGAYRQGGVLVDDDNDNADDQLHPGDDEEATRLLGADGSMSQAAASRPAQTSTAILTEQQQLLPTGMSAAASSLDRDSESSSSSSSSLSHLAQASPVSLPSEPLQVAQFVPEPSADGTDHSLFLCDNKGTLKQRVRSNRGLALLAALACIVCLVSIAITLVVILPQDSHGNEKDTELSERDIIGLAMKEELQDVLGEQFFQNTTSAHALDMAWNWLAYDDPMALPATAPNLLQRFLLALFYFSTSQRGPWRACNPPASFPNNGTLGELCYYDGLVGDGTFTAAGRDYTPEYERFESIIAMQWLSGWDECHWAGIFCDENGVIDAIHLGTLFTCHDLCAGMASLP